MPILDAASRHREPVRTEDGQDAVTVTDIAPPLVARVERAVIAGLAACYLGFVLRSAAVIDGRTTFTLVDDAMISMRYGRNLAEGNGLVFNAGEQVEGYTNLLWTLVMGVVHGVVRDPRHTALVVSLIGVVVLVAQLVGVRALVRRSTDARWAPTLAVSTMGTSFALVFWTLRGMEVGLVGALVLGAIGVTHGTPHWTMRRRAAVVGVLCLLAVFTRDDALVLVVVVVANLVWTLPREQRRRAAALAVGSLALLVAARWSLRVAMYGELLPNTYVLKVGGLSKAVLVERGAAALGYTVSFGLAVPLALSVAAVRTSALARTCLMVVAVQLAYSVAVGGDAWEHFGFANRFVATVTGPLVIAAVVGLIALHRRAVPRVPRYAGLAILGAAMAWLVVAPEYSDHFQVGDGGGAEATLRFMMLAVAVGSFLAASRHMAALVLAGTLVLAGNLLPWHAWFTEERWTDPLEQSWAEYGMALQDATAADALIAASGIGTLGYFADRPIVDILGKVDPVIAHQDPRAEWVVPGHMKWDYRHSVGELRPDVVAHLFAPTPADVAYLESIGYRQIGAVMFVQEPTATAAAEELQHAAEVAS